MRFTAALLVLALTACSAVGSGPSMGKVTFGESLDMSTLTLAGQRSTFQPADDMAFRVELPEAVNATSVRIVVLHKQGAGEQQVASEPMDIGNPEWTVFGTTLDLLSVTSGTTGEYVVRVLRDTTTLAEGTFTVV